MSNRMWGGRFASGPAEIMEEINASIGFDKRLAPQDIRGSLAHVAMLGAAGILPADDVAAIEAGLKSVRDEIEAGRFVFKRELEDIHMSVESRLTEIVGPAVIEEPNSTTLLPPGDRAIIDPHGNIVITLAERS